MKIIDCITYFDEPMLFELRLNILDNYVDEFIVCEAKYSHAGIKKDLNFDISKFKKFSKNKISNFQISEFCKNLAFLIVLGHF